MPSVYSWQERPLSIVESLFEKSSDDSWVSKVLVEFQSLLDKLDNASVIPSLNDHPIHELQPNSLVRFRCMVQDHFENEFFCKLYSMVNTKTGDKEDYEFESEDITREIGMRQVLYCTTVPAENDWMKKTWKNAGNVKLNKAQPVVGNSVKRKRDDADDAEMQCDEPNEREDQSDGKRLKSEGQAQADKPETTFNKNHPLPDETGPVCLVKVYDESAEFKVNDVFEFYGILSIHPGLSSIYDSGHEGASSMDTGDFDENRVHHPPASLVPRLHVVAMKRLVHTNPLIDPVFSEEFVAKVKSEAFSACSSLLSLLQKATLGDSLAAEYLLLHLISRVYARRSSLAIGKFSLNFSGIPPGSSYPRVLSNFLKELVTKAYHFPMSIEKFNSERFIPSKNYNTNRLDSGLLQLSKGTHLILDETTLKPGTMDANGVKNIQALKDALVFQTVDYNFQYHKASFECDISALVLSEGKSLLPCDFQVELKPSDGFPEDIEGYFTSFCSNYSPEVLDKCRSYITSVKLLDFQPGDDMTKPETLTEFSCWQSVARIICLQTGNVEAAIPIDCFHKPKKKKKITVGLGLVIQEDFVVARSQDAEISADDLHAWLVLGRLISISVGHQNLTKQKWERVKALETQRKERLSPSTQFQQNGH